MTFEQYKKEFTQEAINSGFSDQNINNCLKYAETLFQNKVPVIYNTSHLSALVGYNKSYLKRASVYTKYFYRKFEILKKNGKKREISEPLPSLKDIQIWILNNILYKVTVSKYAKAYIPKVSIKQNLIFHKNQEKVFTIDVENFFPSIKQHHINSLFLSFGYSKILSSLFSKICCLNESLPQGAPTSPYLSNLFFSPIDEIISKYCVKREIRYTRYADDMTFSGSFDENILFEFIKETLLNFDLIINEKKTKLMKKNTRQIVTGVVVNEKLQVPFKKRNEIRQSLYYIKKYGITSHMEKINMKKANYLLHLLGEITFVLQINPSDKEFIEYRDYLKKIL
jgi:RNA-directed DNA polymerase